MSVREPEKPARDTCFAERRKNRRLMVRLDITVRPQGTLGLPGAVEQATTRNVSSGDLYFESSLGDRLEIGDIVDVDIELPARGSTIFTEKHLATKGRVVRMGLPSIEEPNRRGVAIVFLKPPAFHAALD